MQDKAAIIAVGSELLSGQITNRNAAWLSAKLFSVGISVGSHAVVDDLETDIVEALEQAATKAGYIFVTGGLGPTSDDLTRQAVARFAGKPLRYDHDSWLHIEKIFSRLRIPVPETNRQQCYFPEGAKVLVNHAGTANAFEVLVSGVRVFVLPGPPREVEFVWQDHIENALASAIAVPKRPIIKMWRTIGRGESHIAELIEGIAGQSGVDIAYRAHAPYIETKIRYLAEDATRVRPILTAIDQVLAPWIYEVDHEDVSKELALILANYNSINLYDGATQGNLVELLSPQLREHIPSPRTLSLATSWESHDAPQLFIRNCLTVNDDVELTLAVAGFDENQGWAVGVRNKDILEVVAKPSPYKGDALRSRNQKAIAALAIRAFYDILMMSRRH